MIDFTKVNEDLYAKLGEQLSGLDIGVLGKQLAIH